MAKKRMFTMNIVDSDAFLDMPLSTQCLYFQLNMRADDDGFVGNPRRIQRTVGASEDDLKLLVAKRFVLAFDDGVIVIKHWRMHNTIAKDRYTPTAYQDELKLLGLKENKSYTFENVDKMLTECQQTDNTDLGLGLDKDLDKGLGLDKGLDKGLDILVPEQSPIPIIEFPLNDKTLYPIFENSINEWAELYPAVDIMQELRNMKGWLNANPTKRKTKNGIKRFINGWLSREQDKGHIGQPKKSEVYKLQNGAETSNPFIALLDEMEIENEKK